MGLKMINLYISGSTQEKNIGVPPYGSEEQQMQEFADALYVCIEKGKGPFKLFRNTGSMSLEETVKDSNNKGADYHLALHSNAGGGKGTECYYWYKTLPEGKKWAECIYNAIAPLTVSSDRGCMPDNALYPNGLYETRETIAWACLVEICFHDYKPDVDDFLANKNKLVKNLALAIYKYFGFTYQENTSSPKNWEQILWEVSPWADVYKTDMQKLNKPDHNWAGLIEKLYYTMPK
jgi:N-acetylmuramoyl-L-alanine amidase